jgi:ABC-2 type transport system ATP-binding protein
LFFESSIGTVPDVQASTSATNGGAPDADPVVVSELTKTYPGPVHAVRGLSFRVRTGEIFGLLGPNGAGKTTTVGVLTTLTRPTSGQAAVGGHDVRTDPVEVRRSIGVVFQDSVLDNDFSGAQNLRLHARLWRVPDAERRIASLLDAVGLTERADDVVWTYSGGMRRRLEIGRALLGDPKVMFLDEPTLGLDPIARRDLWQVVRTLRERRGVTIVLSTHYLEEAQNVCDRVAIVDKGLIVEEGKPTELVDRLGNEVADLALGDDRDATQLLAALDGGPGHIIRGGSGVSIASAEPRQQLTDRISALPLSELGVTTMTVRPATLNDVFLHLTASAPEHDLATALGSRG